MYWIQILVFGFLLALSQAQGFKSNETNSNNTFNSSSITPNANFATPPPIVQGVLLVLNKSIVDGKYIGSNRLQSLELKLNLPTGADPRPSTTFRLTAFNSTATSNSRSYQVTSPGSWSYVTGTQNTLSCIVIYQQLTNYYGLLQYLADQQSFIMLAAVPLSQFTSDPITPSDVKASFTPKQNCEGGFLSGTLYRLAGTSIVSVPLPAGWSVLSSPEFLRYGVASNILYRYNPINGNFTELYTFPSNNAYDIRSSTNNRLLVVAANITTLGNDSNFNQTLYLFNAPTNSANISIITQMSFTAVAPSTTVAGVYPYLASPLLTKIGVICKDTKISTSTIKIKSIDPNNNAVSDLAFQDPNRILNTINMQINAPKFFGDFYFVVRNDSASAIANTSFVEEAYQYVGNQIIFLRNRILVANDSTGFVNTYIDPTTQNQLVVLNTYSVTDGLAIKQFIYGNIASVHKVIQPTTPPFISLIIASGAVPFIASVEPTSPLTWIYSNQTADNNTNITIVQSNSSFPNNVKINSNVLPGTLSIISMNSNCIVTRNTANNTISIASPPSPTNSSNFTASNTSAPFAIQDITALLANITLTNTTKWGLSDKCDRFSVNSMVFFRTPNQSNFQAINNNISTFNPLGLSRNLDAAIVGSSIWLLNPNGNIFTQAFNISKTLLTNSNIYRKDNRIIIAATNNTAAQILAIDVNNNTTFDTCLDYFFPFYQNEPRILVSPQLSKVLVMGHFIFPNQTQVQPRFDAFFVAFANKTSLNISFPLDKIPDPVNSFFLIEDQFLYIRSLPSSSILSFSNSSILSNSTNSSNSSISSNSFNSSSHNPQENVFFISRDVTPLLASSVNLTQTQLISWRRTAFSAVDDGKMKIYVETSETVNGTYFAVVTVKQVSGQQASLNSDSSQGITGILDSLGKIKLCGTGCTDCSSGTCTGCSTMFAFDSSASLCYACGPNCATCSSTNTLTCTSCISFTYLSNGTCLPCDKSCLTCNVTATTCTSCLPGQSLTTGQCNASCPKHCISCNGTICLTCISGFIVSNGSCRGCVASCSSCSASNITQCTSCAPGLTLVNSACVPCPDKCQTCSSGVCATCIPGFSPNANGVCVLACQISCATCADNQPAVCLSCYSGAYLNGSSCVLNTTCNTDLSCTDCGQGLDYILVGSMCVQCTSISNCLQCNTGNSQQCSKCFNGYYIDGNYLCQACPSSCITCNSADVCTGCVIGYTLPQNQTQGQCIACQSPCASCLGVSTYCLSCVDGYTKKGWKCQSNKYVGFSLVLVGAAPSDVLSSIDTLLQNILFACKLNDTSSITFFNITSASTIVAGSLTTSDPISTSQSFSNNLSKGSLGDYTVGSSSVTANGVSSSSTNSNSEQSKTNTGLIIGLVIGLTAFVVILVVVICVVYKKKQDEDNTVPSESGKSEATPAMKSNQAIDKDLPESAGNVYPEFEPAQTL